MRWRDDRNEKGLSGKAGQPPCSRRNTESGYTGEKPAIDRYLGARDIAGIFCGQERNCIGYLR